MDTIDPESILKAFRLHDWYAFAALIQMLVLQIVRTKNVPVLTNLWNRVPDGWRWTSPLILGAMTAFTAAFAYKQSFGVALLAAIGGALGIGIPSMGLHAGLKESPAPVDGGRGGKTSTVDPA